MKLFSSLLFVILVQVSWTQDSISVLFIGNSYLSVNNLPAMVGDLSNSLGDHMLIDSKMNGGYTFQSHSNDAVTYTKIHAKPWDYVVLQGQSQEPSFPYSQVNTQTLPYAMKLADSVYASNSCSQVNYYMTWGREVGDPQWDSINTFNKMNDRLRNAYLRIADSTDASVSPVGVAWKYVRDNYPNINLYAGDGSHPSLEGSYLAACTFYSSLFQKSSVGASYTAGLDPQTCTILQQAASSIVLDSIPTWELIHHDSLLQATFIAGINQYEVLFSATTNAPSNLVWDFGDGSPVGFGLNPSHTYAPGTYTVTLYASGTCGVDTVQQQVTVNTVSLDDIKTQWPYLYQNEQGDFVCQTRLFEVMNIEALNLAGQQIPVAHRITSDGTITFPYNPDIFMIRIDFDHYVLIQRLH
ncbi:MAG: PKD domain-containing protein [Crocinitomicaceae bacterium]|jgi:PKD repeat protein|nr:PKD domain-containing protein [Crocinitomicaceae bacterium]MDP4761696.1 PKD domain-containing protein [Crocinitomicaceae bacterium]